MDRVTAFAGQIALETDMLRSGQFAMVGNAKTNEAVLGTAPTVSGFALTATSPASLVLNLGPGTIFQQQSLEATPWSSLPADTAHLIVKQGITLDPIPLTFTPPATSGYSQSFLIEVQIQESDTDLILRPYFNAANTQVQLPGPGGSGTKDSTTRKDGVYALIKPGAAVNSGSPTAPAPDSGFVGLYVVTIAAGATTLTAANISVYAGAPFIATPLPAVPTAVQSGTWIYARDGGTQNNIAFTTIPVQAAYAEGQGYRVKVAFDCNGASTANYAGLGASPVRTSGGGATVGGEWKAGDIIELIRDTSSWQFRGVFGATPATSGGSNTQTPIGDANYTVKTGDRRLVTTTALTAPRTLTLPSAAAFGIGDLAIVDRVGAVGPVNTLSFVPSGLDQIEGGASYTYGFPFRSFTLRSDGSSRWTYDRGAAPNLHAAGDANVTISPFDPLVATSTALTAPRTWTLPAANSVLAGTPIVLADLFGACSTSFGVTIARSGSDTINGLPSITMTAAYFQLTAVSDGSGRWAIQYLDLTQIQNLLTGVADGQCRLSWVDAQHIKLSPLGGTALVVGGFVQQVPTAGVTAVNIVGGVPAVANTLYYVYVQMVSGSMTLQLSTTGHTTDAFGRENKTGDATQRLVGAVYTNASGQFQNDATWRGLSNYFNRQSLPIDGGVVTNQTIPVNGQSQGANTPIDNTIPFYNWLGERVELYALATTSSGAAYTLATVYVDGAGAGIYGPTYPVGGHAAYSAGGSTNCSVAVVLAEGMHTTQGIVAGSGPGGATTINVDYARHFGIIRG